MPSLKSSILLWMTKRRKREKIHIWEKPFLRILKKNSNSNKKKVYSSLQYFYNPEIQESILNDPKIQTVYGDIANILKEYRSGKLPKAFKYIPVMDQWDKVLGLTKPEDWTPHAMRVATKIFSSSLDMYRAQQFYENVKLLTTNRDYLVSSSCH
jgi:Bystin.